MHLIYKRGDPSSAIYFAERGPIQVEFEGFPAEKIRRNKLVVGTLEFLLEQSSGTLPNRYFDFSVEHEASLKAFPLDMIPELMQRYEFGFNCNIFLSEIIRITNRLFTERVNVTREERQIQIRARIFTRHVDEMMSVGFKLGLFELLELAERFKLEPLYREGAFLTVQEHGMLLRLPENPEVEFLTRFRGGTIICRTGEKKSHMYVLLSGKVVVSFENQRLAEICETGEAFGEMSLFLGEPRSATLIAETDTELYVIRRKDLRRFHETHPDVFSNIAATLAARCAHNLKRLDQLPKGKEAQEGENAFMAERALRAKQSKQLLNELFTEVKKVRETCKMRELDRLWDQFQAGFGKLAAD